jgi:hypothetical protein
LIWDIRLWQESLVYYIASPTLLLTFVWLAFHNFKRGVENGGLWRRNVLVLTSALVFTVCSTAAVYNRAWELSTPLEPPHGPARLMGEKTPVLKSCGAAALTTYGGLSLALLLPGGRLWVDRIAYDPGRIVLSFGKATGFRIGGRWTSLNEKHFMAGSNWVAGVAKGVDTVAVRADGTLWVSEKPGQPGQGTGKRPAAEPDKLVQFGNETNWQNVVYEYLSSVILLKRDGTLWRWGANRFLELNKNGAWLRSYQPRRLSADSDWAKIMPTGNSIYAWKSDGRAWVIHPLVRTRNKFEFAYNFEFDFIEMGRLPDFDRVDWRSLTHSWPLDVGVRDDGTLWAWTINHSSHGQIDGGLGVRMEQIGMETNWVTVSAGNPGAVAAVKTDGTLWRWEHGPELTELTQRAPTRLGIHNDWVAVGGAMDGTLSLAKDGSLWYWCRQNSTLGSSFQQPLMAPSGKPLQIENIFDH